MTYSLLLATEKVGTVSVEREGLYYRIHCRCRPMEQMTEVVVKEEGQRRTLGLLIPQGGAWELNTRIPIKQLGEELSFFLQSREAGSEVSVEERQPFPYLARLQEAYLICTQEGVKIGFRKKS